MPTQTRLLAIALVTCPHLSAFAVEIPATPATPGATRLDNIDRRHQGPEHLHRHLIRIHRH